MGFARNIWPGSLAFGVAPTIASALALLWHRLQQLPLPSLLLRTTPPIPTSKPIWLALLASLACAIAASASAQQPQPNILFILADNVGYGDLGAYGGGELRGSPTPRIDQLAAEGLRLTQFLVEPGCTPSRAALMTGRYSIRSGLSLVAVEGSATGSLPATEITMAEMLRDAG